MSTEYIDARAKELAHGKNMVCRRTIEKALQEVKARHAQGLYGAANEALEELDMLVSREPACKPRKRALQKTTYKRDRGKKGGKSLG